MKCGGSVKHSGGEPPGCFHTPAMFLRRKIVVDEIIPEAIPHVGTVKGAVTHVRGFAEKTIGPLNLMELGDGIVDPLRPV